MSFGGGLAASWERWGNPLVDCGREMQQPLRLADGEVLYSQVRHIYGPLSPYLHAVLFRFFGPHLYILYASGIVSALIILLAVYWLARQLMGPLAAATAALSVTWLCAFKQAGNYILPYAYSALHGCALGLLTLIVLLKFLKSRNWVTLFAAGILAGATTLAKTEMGMAAGMAGVATAIVAGEASVKRACGSIFLFAAPALGLPIAVYSVIASRVGFATLAADNFLFLSHVPPQFVYFNKRISGFTDPLASIALIAEAAIRYGALAVLVAAASRMVSERRSQHYEPIALSSAGRATFGAIQILFVGSLLIFVGLTIAGYRRWDTGPYLAMPFLLIWLIVPAARRFWRNVSRGRFVSARTQIIVVMSVYAGASLARILLRVRSGGAYSAYLIPVSVILFVYFWMAVLPRFLGDHRTRLMFRKITLGVILADLVVTAGLISYRYLKFDTYPIATWRGRILTLSDLGVAFDQAISLIDQQTKPGDAVAVFPEGTALDFLAERRNPIREEIVTPGYLNGPAETRAINQLKESNAPLVLITNRATSEFGQAVFGRDYCQQLMSWIEENYEFSGVLGPRPDPSLQIGDRTFFIRVYRKKELK